MDRINPNCIAGASSPYKVVSFTVPDRALLSLSITAKPSLKEEMHENVYKNFKKVKNKKSAA